MYRSVGQLSIPHCYGPSSRNEYLVHRSKVGPVVLGKVNSQLIIFIMHHSDLKTNIFTFTFNRHLKSYKSATFLYGVFFSGQCKPFEQSELKLDPIWEEIGDWVTDF